MRKRSVSSARDSREWVTLLAWFLVIRLRALTRPHVKIAGGVGVATVLCAGAVFAQTAEPQRPTFRSLRFDEDWSVLRDPRLRTDPWDRVKFIRLGKEDRYLSLGGESRLRYDQFRNANFGTGPQDGNGFALQRYLFHADLHVEPRLRVFVQLQSGIETGRAGGPRPTDEDVLDLHQAFVDVRAGPAGRRVVVRVGRQELEFGSGRLIAASEGLNVRRSFDAIRPIYRHGTWEWNGLIARLVETSRGAFDDGRVPGEWVWGVGGSGPHGVWPNAILGVYLYGFDRERAPFAQRTGHEHRYTLGSRHQGRAGSLAFNTDLIYQWGRFDADRIRAWAIASDLRATLPGSRVFLGIRTNVASGDRDRQDRKLQTFNPMFPSTSYSGRTALQGPSNLIDVTPSLRIQAWRSLAIVSETAVIWRQSTSDTIFGVNARPFGEQGGSDADARFIGVQPSFQGEWQFDVHSLLVLTVSQFRRGAHLREVGAKSVTYLGVYWSYRF